MTRVMFVGGTSLNVAKSVQGQVKEQIHCIEEERNLKYVLSFFAECYLIFQCSFWNVAAGDGQGNPWTHFSYLLVPFSGFIPDPCSCLERAQSEFTNALTVLAFIASISFWECVVCLSTLHVSNFLEKWLCMSQLLWRFYFLICKQLYIILDCLILLSVIFL